MTMDDICDKIFDICLKTQNLNTDSRFSIQNVLSANGINRIQSEAALQHLIKVLYLEKHGENFVLTPDGEDFAKRGGYAAKRQREQEERDLKVQVSQSSLHTNSTMRVVGWASLGIAVCAVMVSVINLFTKHETILQVQAPPQQQVSQQTPPTHKPDSLQNLQSHRVSPSQKEKAQP